LLFHLTKPGTDVSRGFAGGVYTYAESGGEPHRWRDQTLRQITPTPKNLKTSFWASSALALTLACSSATGQTYDWQVRRSPISEHLYDVTYAQGMYVAVGNHRTILTSRNGASWTVRAHEPESQGWFSSVAYGNGAFVAVGNGNRPDTGLSSPPGSGGYSTSTNGLPLVLSRTGIHWRPLRRRQPSLTAVAFGQKRLVAVGPDGIIASRDGRDWFHPTNFFNVNEQRIGPEMLPPDLTEIDYGNGPFNGRFVILGTRGNLMTSSSGLDWVSYTGFRERLNFTFTALGHNRALSIAAARDSGGNRMFVSPGGGWWEIVPPSFSVVALGGGKNSEIIAAGYDQQGGHCIQLWRDGLDWSATPSQIPGVH